MRQSSMVKTTVGPRNMRGMNTVAPPWEGIVNLTMTPTKRSGTSAVHMGGIPHGKSIPDPRHVILTYQKETIASLHPEITPHFLEYVVEEWRILEYVVEEWRKRRDGEEGSQPLHVCLLAISPPVGPLMEVLITLLCE